MDKVVAVKEVMRARVWIELRYAEDAGIWYRALCDSFGDEMTLLGVETRGESFALSWLARTSMTL